MSSINSFFAQNVISNTVEEVVVSDRFKDQDGISVKWQLKAISEEENEVIRKSCTNRTKGKSGQTITETDQHKYALKLAVASIVFPNLKDEALQDSYGVRGEDNVLRKMLLSGEYANLLVKVQQINGYDRDFNEQVDEAKN